MSSHQGLFVSAKFFEHPDFRSFKRDRLERSFAKVRVDKPEGSRAGERRPHNEGPRR